MNEFEKNFRALKKYINKLESLYINHHLGIVESTKKYEFDVKSYCILAHAAIEEFMENVSIKLLNDSVNNIIRDNKISQSLLGLFAWGKDKRKLKIDMDETKPEVDIINELKTIAGCLKDDFNKTIESNHGISPKYIRRLLLPLTVNIKNDLTLINSLKKIAETRGEYSHNKTITLLLGPEDAKNYVNDCLVLCEDIKEQAKRKNRKKLSVV